MSKVTFDISVSLDGYVAGPNQSPDAPLGEGGMQLHEWVFGLKSWREPHGESGGRTGPEDDLVKEAVESAGAAIMGRGMFGGGGGEWDESWKGWWGDEPPFRHPVFVLTHHPRERLEFENGTTIAFVTDGIESALEQARDAAGERNVAIGGGADTIQQYLRAGLVDEFQIHVVPIFLGGGARLFDGVEAGELELVRVVDSPSATHLRYRQPS
jgi:dihydrofolate reductase